MMTTKRRFIYQRIAGGAKPARLLLCLLVFCSSVAITPDAKGSESQSERISAPELQRLFESANDKFRAGLEISKTDRPAAEALFREAAGAWREVARVGNIHNVKLETNIANASLLGGEVPGAILAYRRALSIDPTDRAVIAGLAAARRSAGTEALALGQSLGKKEDGGRAAAREGGVRGALAAIGGVVRDASERVTIAVSSRILILVAAIGYVAIFGCATLRILGRVRTPGWVFALMFAVMAAATGPLLVREIRTSRASEAVVLASNVVARNGPAELYDPAFQEPLRAGLEVAIVERRGAWTMIRLRDGREAWVRDDTLAVV